MHNVEKIFSLNSKVSRNSTEDRYGVDADEGAEFDKKGLDLKNDPLEDSRLILDQIWLRLIKHEHLK